MRVKNILIAAISIIIVAGVVFEVVNAIMIVRSTGTLQVKTSDSSATLAISQHNKEAQYIGAGATKVRLKPGIYLVSATDQSEGVTTMASITVAQGRLTSKTLYIARLIQQAKKNNKLLAKLPITGPASQYYINYYFKYSNGQSYPVITISSSSAQGKQAALSWMRFYGFNPSDYQIQYETVPAASNSGNFYVGGSPDAATD